MKYVTLTVPANIDILCGAHITQRPATEEEIEELQAEMQPDGWTVKRWSGRDMEPFKAVFKGDETRARAEYAKRKDALRQGSVRLVNPEGLIVEKVTAFRNRTRW